jgi:hypothetical protein
MSAQMAAVCCKEFAKAIIQKYQSEYKRIPTTQDLKAISNLHKHVHKIDGMFGSLDCMQTYWKNCPGGWKGQYKGKEKKASIVLEAACDYQMWFWHTTYGYPGTMNDLNVFHLSPLKDSFINGSFTAQEQASGVVPFTIGDKQFDKMFILVDGIYPQLARFIKGIKEPIGDRQEVFTGWQESARKDIERAFGNLQNKFQYMARPFMGIDLDNIGNNVGCCLILHNMCVSDRVMEGDVRAWYRPDNNYLAEEEVLVNPRDLLEQQQRDGIVPPHLLARIGIRNMDAELRKNQVLLNWGEVKDKTEHYRLTNALMDYHLSLRQHYLAQNH